MQIEIDARQLVQESERAAELSASLRERAWVRVRVVSFDAERAIKIAMPVRTGRARGSWGHSTPPALPTEGIWLEDRLSLAITQGSRVGYITRLNEGSSSQAPAGFIDAAEVRAANRLVELLADDITGLFE